MVPENSAKLYKETSIKTAGSIKMIVMLYDEAVRQLDSAVLHIKEKTRKLDLVNNAIGKAQDIITELLVSLDMEKGGEVAKNLHRLYFYFNQALTDANIKKDHKKVEQIQGMLIELRDVWDQLAEQGPNIVSENGGINIAG